MDDGGEHQGDARATGGLLVGGCYRLVERIGSGGTGAVWRAHDELVDREVAVKQPRLPGGPEDEDHRRAARRLYREARAAARVDHPSAVVIHDVVVEDEAAVDGGLPWIVMELVRGESLHQALRRGPLPFAEAARIGLAVLGALRAAHAVGIVHRDVKPANVLLGPPPLPAPPGRERPGGRVVLTDFGIAQVQGEESLTAGGESVGSLEFVAPERMSGRGIAGPASDLWSLGVLLYAAVEGRSPFRRTTPEATLAAVLGADPPEPERAGPLGPLLVRLLAKDPGRRPGPEETAEALSAAAREGPRPPRDGTAAVEQDGAEPNGFADDAGTVALGGGARGDGADAAGGAEDARGTEDARTAGSAEDARTARPAGAPGPALGPSRPLRRRPASVALLGVLLVGGAWFATSSFVGAEGEPAAAPPASSRPRSTAEGWTEHREKEMDAVLSVPASYQESARQGDASDQPRLVIYEKDGVEVRLTQWDRAPRSPMGQAQDAHAGWARYDGDARTRYTRTRLGGHEAVLADTAYDHDGSPARVIELMVRTGDSRLYELRVDMPRGAPGEKRGAAVFEGVRDRLEIG